MYLDIHLNVVCSYGSSPSFLAPDSTYGKLGHLQHDRLAAAVSLHIAVALDSELVAGQAWATLQPVQDCGTRCLGGTTPGSGPSGQLVVPPCLLGELGSFGLG
jgi:hypothetical protein